MHATMGLYPPFHAELPLSATAGQLQLALHDTDLHTKTVVRVDTANEEETLAFEDEAVENPLYQLPAVRSGSLEDTWRIDPDQLKIRRKLGGELCMLGKGGSGSVSSPCSFCPLNGVIYMPFWGEWVGLGGMK